MAHSGHGMMDMGADGGMGECSMHMLGNWEVIGACFLTNSWQIATKAQFAGTCIGVFLMVVLIESIRRWGREWDRYIVRTGLERRRVAALARSGGSASACCRAPSSSDASEKDSASLEAGPNVLDGAPRGAATIARLERAFFGLPRGSAGEKALRSASPPTFRPTVVQQAVRSIVYAVQFTGAYIIMLIAMSFNGYVLISICLGGLVGHFFTTWDFADMPLDDEADLLTAPNGGASTAGTGAASAVAAQESARKRTVIGSYGEGSGACCG